MKFPYLLLLAAVVTGASSPALAQLSLDEQVAAVRRAEQEQKAREQAAQAELERRARADYERQLAQEALEREAAREVETKRLELQRERERAARAAQAAAAAKREELAARDRAYEDQHRSLNLDERRIELEVQKARAARTHDLVDQELKRMEAETDVVQSAADSARNVSEGVKNNLTSDGKAAETVSQGIKSNLSEEKSFFEEWFSSDEAEKPAE
jgi:hypothetical protein